MNYQTANWKQDEMQKGIIIIKELFRFPRFDNFPVTQNTKLHHATEM